MGTTGQARPNYATRLAWANALRDLGDAGTVRGFAYKRHACTSFMTDHADDGYLCVSVRATSKINTERGSVRFRPRTNVTVQARWSDDVRTRCATRRHAIRSTRSLALASDGMGL